MKYPVFWPQFFTATILEWKSLLKQDKYKDVVIESLRFLVAEKRINLYAFVIMNNHIHLVWQPIPEFTPDNIQHSLMSFTAHQFKNDLKENHPKVLSHFKVEAKDREYQFWERNPLGIDLFNEAVFIQKLDYIHWNPVHAGLCKLPEQYYYSSAKFYEYGIDDFGMLTHYKGLTILAPPPWFVSPRTKMHVTKSICKLENPRAKNRHCCCWEAQQR